MKMACKPSIGFNVIFYHLHAEPLDANFCLIYHLIQVATNDVFVFVFLFCASDDGQTSNSGKDNFLSYVSATFANFIPF